MKKLIAKVPILYKSHLYGVGEELPTNNPQMVKAWTEAETAVWKGTDPETESGSGDESEGGTESGSGDETEDGTENVSAVKAKAVTAEPGLSGQALVSESGDGDNLVGKVPKTTARSKK